MSTGATAINLVSSCINYVFGIPLLFLGTIGAILTIIIFIRHESFLRIPTVHYLVAGAVMTAIHLPLIYTQIILTDGFGVNIINSGVMICRQYNYLLYVTTVPTISFPCWAAFDQYASTSSNILFRARWNSVRTARFTITGTLIFTIIIYIPMTFLSGIQNGICVLLDDSYKKFNNYFLTPLLFTFAPLLLIFGFTLGTIRNIRKFTITTQRDHITKQIRRMLIPQLILISISGIPYGSLGIYLTLTSKVQKSPVQLAVERLCLQLIRLFYHIYYASVFFIYGYKSKEVRKIFRQIVCKHFQRNRITPSNMSKVNLIPLKIQNVQFNSRKIHRIDEDNIYTIS